MTAAPALAALRAPFPPEQIGKLPKGTVQLDYVGHADVTARLLDVDPQWTWEPMATVDGLPALDQFGNLWIRLTILGTTRIGVGDGKSMKECIGDAIRNAAMRFGVALDLWAKGDRTFGTAGHDAPAREQVARFQSPADALRDDLLALCERRGLDVKQVAQDFADGHGMALKDADEKTVKAFLELVRSGIPGEQMTAAQKKDHKALVEDTQATEKPAERLDKVPENDPWYKDGLPIDTGKSVTQ